MSSDQFYLDLINEVVPLLEEYGKEFVVTTPAVRDNTTGEEISPPQSRTVTGLVSDTRFFSGNLENTIKGEKVLLLEPSAAPKPNETVDVDGEDYALPKAQPIKPANITVLYILDLQR